MGVKRNSWSDLFPINKEIWGEKSWRESACGVERGSKGMIDLTLKEKRGGGKNRAMPRRSDFSKLV